MASAMQETNEVARDRDLLASCSALAAEAQCEDEASVYLQKMAFARTGIRAVTTSRTLIACYRMVAQSEGSAFCDATGSAISKIRVRPNTPDTEIRTFALSVPCFAGGQLSRPKPLRMLTAHSSSMLSATTEASDNAQSSLPCPSLLAKRVPSAGVTEASNRVFTPPVSLHVPTPGDLVSLVAQPPGSLVGQGSAREVPRL